MKRFDRILEDCLHRIENGESLENCLQRYPGYADELTPLLRTALELRGGASLPVAEAFKERSRAQLTAYMQAHPFRSSLQETPRSGSHTIKKRHPHITPITQAVGLFSVLAFAFLTTGTALAQSALPGQTLYTWKRASESVWQAVSPDPVATDLALAQRRAREAVAVSGSDRTIALQGYEQVLNRLAAQSQDEPSIQREVVPVLNTQRDDLEKSGIKLPKLDEYLAHPGENSSKNSPAVTPEPTSIHKKHPKKSTGGKQDGDILAPTPVLMPTPTPLFAPLPRLEGLTATPETAQGILMATPTPEIIPNTPTPPPTLPDSGQEKP